jgi:hypothetical protein
MTSGQPLEISRNKSISNNTRERFIDRLNQVVLVSLLAATGFIHWYLPVVHPTELLEELTGGIIVMSHQLLHLLFNLNGAGYFVLVALLMGWLPLAAHHQRRLYGVVAGYAAATILVWLVLSEPAERGLLDYATKLIEGIILALTISMMQRINKRMATLEEQD